MINLMFCGNDKVFDGMIISLLSITKHTKEELNVYILTMGLPEVKESFIPVSEDKAEVLDGIVKKANSKSKVILIDITKIFKEEMLKSANMKTHYTPYILVRLFSDKIKDLPDKILYLDCDIVCYKDIKELYDNDIEDYEIGAVQDFIGKRMISKKYINSGMLLMNLKKIRETGSFTKAREICNKRRMMMPDQTAINISCKPKLYLPDKFNEQDARKDDTVIRHFSMKVKFFPWLKFTNIKPWNIDRVHNEYQIYDYEDIIEEYQKIINKEVDNKVSKKEAMTSMA